MVVRKEKCVNCGKEFTIDIDEFIHKLDHGMRLPKRCKECRAKRRMYPDPFEGIISTMKSYPSTKGHRHKIHGGVL